MLSGPDGNLVPAQPTVLVLWIGAAERVSAMRSTSTTRLGRGSAQPRTSLVG
ncbi:hypothetical protein ACIP4X_21795 [Streptomyces sp. NPDC088817]|uniref:hypothetical protein n=1 Tax=unclassified Streptomyces TaxID=2593676 RepID=UPI00380C2F1F